MNCGPFVLLIIDGWGLREETDDNAVALARTPVMDELWAQYPHARLQAHGEAVGLMPGQMGNSNVGHLNLGAGRIVYQDLLRITNAIDDESFFSNEVLWRAVDAVRDRGGRLHLAGLVSDGGVHSHIDHILALMELAHRAEVPVWIHCFLDGRDVPPRSAIVHLKRLERECERLGNCSVATVSGRYYAMDRDRRWERTKLAFQMLTGGPALIAGSVITAVNQAYARGENDEFVQPTVIAPQGVIRDGDRVIMFNFRADRMRQITRALSETSFDEFDRGDFRPVPLVAMTEYDREFSVPVAFANRDLVNTVGEVVSKQGLKQFRIAETEKYAHVTFFLSGGREQPFPGEERVLIPSPHVATYDLQPEMSARQVADRAALEISSGQYPLVILNFANPDMVGHTGILNAAISAVETVDQCVGRVVSAVRSANGRALIVSDHGNAELMRDPDTGQPHTAHTTSPVPLIAVTDEPFTLADGILSDVSPTALDLMKLDIPPEMDRGSLVITPGTGSQRKG